VSPNVPEAPRGKAQNKRPACALSAIFWRVGPSTRGATAPQRAQQVNFVVRCTACVYALIAKEGNQGVNMRLSFVRHAA
jgi:hypothetical protein